VISKSSVMEKHILYMQLQQPLRGSSKTRLQSTYALSTIISDNVHLRREGHGKRGYAGFLVTRESIDKAEHRPCCRLRAETQEPLLR